MFGPLKITGWRQGIYQQKNTRRHALGELRHWNNKIFRYSKAGESLSMGKLNQSSAVNGGLLNEAIVTAVATKTKTLSLTVTTGATLAANDLAGSDFIVNDGPGQGQCLPITGNGALTSSGTNLTITLGQGILVALTTDSEFSIQLNIWLSVVEDAQMAHIPCGVPPIDVTDGYYFWDQTGGMCSVLSEGSASIGQTVGSGDSNSTHGATEVISAVTEGVVGLSPGTQVDTEYSPLYLTIDR